MRWRRISSKIEIHVPAVRADWQGGGKLSGVSEAAPGIRHQSAWHQ
jgi:hypothetical protein